MANKSELDIHRPVYTLGIASQLSGIPAHSIRQYIDQKLIIPFKLASKRHLFSQVDIDRIRHIHRLIHENGLNFSGIRTMMAMIPCWAIRGCSVKERSLCNAYNEHTSPCWAASEKGRQCKNDNCRICEAYTRVSNEADLKSLLREMVQ